MDKSGEAQGGSGARGTRLRLWAVLTGVVLTALLCYVSLYGNMVLSTYLSIEYCMAGALLFLLALVLIINPLLKLIDRHAFGRPLLAFSGRELGLIFVMLALASGLVTMGFVENLIPLMTGDTYYVEVGSKIGQKVISYVPEWARLTDRVAARQFYEGLPPGESIPWKPWVKPLLWWSVFAFAYFAVSVALMVVMRKQWMERERLVYPIAQAPIELTNYEKEERLFPRIFRSRLMWFCAALPFILSSMNCLNVIWPVVPKVNLGGRITIIQGVAGLRMHFSWVVAGFSYLLNTQVSLSLWLFQVLYVFQTALFSHLGYSLGKKDPFSHLEPAVSHQAAGAMLVFVAASLWTARRHLISVVRSLWRRVPEAEDPAAIMSYRACVIVILLGVGIMTGWLMAWGMQWWSAAVFVFLGVLSIYFLARVVAQAGLPAARPVLIPQAMMTHAVGTNSFTPEGLTAMVYGFSWSADVRTSVMASMGNGLRVMAETDPPKPPRSQRLTILIAVALALVVSLAVSYWTLISIAYDRGGINANSWFFRGLPKYSHLYAIRLIRDGIPASPDRWVATGVGGGIMGLLILARNRLLWWPVHPIGFVMGASAPVQWSWTGIFAAWLVKALFLRYGGPALYRKTRDGAIGLIVGQILCAGVWFALGVIFDLPQARVPIL